MRECLLKQNEILDEIQRHFKEGFILSKMEILEQHIAFYRQNITY